MSSALATLKAAIETAVVAAWGGAAVGTILVNQADVAAGDESVAVDGVTTRPAVGEWLRVAGDSTLYQITAVGALALGACTIDFTPPAEVAWADDAAISFFKTPIAFPKAPFTPPDAPWLRATILWGESRMYTGGSGVSGNRVVGLLNLALFDHLNEGTGRITGYADILRNAFSRVDVGTAHFLAPGAPRETEDGEFPEWAMVVVSAPFDAKET